MSRIGKMPIEVPPGVDVKISKGEIEVKGQKGSLRLKYHSKIKVTNENNRLLFERASNSREDRSLHGLTRSLVNNMVVGVTQGFQKALEINGIGYRASLSGKTLTLNLGYSHPVTYKAPDGIDFELDQKNRIIVKGIDKQLVGQVAAEIRSFRKPEPYKGKGIKYEDERIRRKVGKAGA